MEKDNPSDFIGNVLIILAVLIISVAISIYFTYDETYKEVILVITAIAGFILALIEFIRKKKINKLKSLNTSDFLQI